MNKEEYDDQKNNQNQRRTLQWLRPLCQACHEGAIEMIDGKAKLVHEHYCDGLGDCLPACPANAITFEEREAPAYDEAAVKAAQAEKAGKAADEKPALACGCPGSMAKAIHRSGVAQTAPQPTGCPGLLSQWPVQIKLVPEQAPYYHNANLLIAPTVPLMHMEIPPGFHPKPHHAHRMSKTGRRRLHGETDLNLANNEIKSLRSHGCRFLAAAVWSARQYRH